MKILHKYILLMLVFSSGLSISQYAQSETGLQTYDSMSKGIIALNKKKQWIQLSKMKFAYDGSTRIIDYKGNLVTADALEEGAFVTIKLDVKQKYIGRPLLREIRIETAEEE